VHGVFASIKQCVCFGFHALQELFLPWVKPPTLPLVLGTVADLTRSKSELLAENALLRQQLIILRRQVKRPVSRKTDRLLLVLLARMTRTWKQAPLTAIFLFPFCVSLVSGEKERFERA
jgi:hypothetical protein